VPVRAMVITPVSSTCVDAMQFECVDADGGRLVAPLRTSFQVRFEGLQPVQPARSFKGQRNFPVCGVGDDPDRTSSETTVALSDCRWHRREGGGARSLVKSRGLWRSESDSLPARGALGRRRAYRRPSC
jgi:hypothetical protein